MYEVIKKKLENLSKNTIILVITPPQHYNEINLFLLKYWLDLSKDSGAYISLNRPYNNLIETFDSGKIEHKRLFFIDCVTKNEQDVANCYFLKTQQSLTNLSIAVSTVIRTQKPSFIFLDSLNTLALYNETDAAIKFAHFLIAKLRANKLDGIILGVQDEKSKKMLAELSQMCDKIIDLTDTTFFV